MKKTLEKVEKASCLDNFYKSGIAGPISSRKAKLFEFRIPPQSRGGVLRLYCGRKKTNNDVIFILTGEVKKGRSSASPERVREAEKRYKEVCL